jgi:hypothetical protein
MFDSDIRMAVSAPDDIPKNYGPLGGKILQHWSSKLL